MRSEPTTTASISTRGHEMAGHVVGDERHRDPFAHQLPGREAGALEIGARLVGDDTAEAAPCAPPNE